MSFFRTDPNPRLPSTVVAVAEGRREQCGLACFDLNDPLRVVLCRTSETSKTWADTVNTVYAWSPSVVLLPLSRADSQLATRLEDTFERSATTTLRYLAKSAFREGAGIAILDRLSVQNPGGAAFRSDYLLTMAISALVAFLETSQGMFFAEHCIRFEERASSGRLLMDRSTIENLELVANRRTGKQKGSLFGILSPSCNTGCGARLIRSAIMSPTTCLTTINARLDTVSLIMRHPELAVKLRQHLKRVSIEPLMRTLAFVPQTITRNMSRRAIQGLLKCSELLRLLPFIAGTVRKLTSAASCETGSTTGQNHGGSGSGSGGSLWDDSSTECLEACATNLGNPAFQVILQTINSRLDRSITEGLHKSGWDRTIQEIFAVSAGTSGTLDMSRKTVLCCIEEIDRLFLEYKDRWGISGMKLTWNDRVGHHLRMPSTSGGNELPRELDVFKRTKKWTYCTTSAMARIVKRTSEGISDAYRHTYEELRSLLDVIRQSIPVISTIADTISWLDLVSTFADVSTKSAGYVRPTLVEGNGAGVLAIKAGRHPVSERLLNSNFVQNDVLLDQATSSFQLVLGPNSSGKSTYLRQIALICILGQSGCFVPAQRCQLQILDRIFTRLSTEDDIQGNLSTFSLECAEAAYIMSNLTTNSLTLFDEFGRSTSTREALGLSFAVAEYFLHTKSLTLFATHFSELCGLSSLYRNATVSYLDFIVDKKFHIRRYTHELKYGRPPHMGTDYGIQHAVRCGWDPIVIEEASKLRLVLLQRSKTKDTANALRTTTQHADMIHNTIKRLLVLGKHKHEHSIRSDASSLVSYVQAAMKLLPAKQALQKYLGLGRAAAPEQDSEVSNSDSDEMGGSSDSELGNTPNRADLNLAALKRGSSSSRQQSPASSQQQISADEDPLLLSSSSSEGEYEEEEFGNNNNDDSFGEGNGATKMMVSKGPGFYSKNKN